MHASILNAHPSSRFGLLGALLLIVGCSGEPSSLARATAQPRGSPADEIEIPDDWQLMGQLPTDYVPGSFTLSDLDGALARGDAAAHDILWLLYWIDRVDESSLLEVLQAHGYGVDDLAAMRAAADRRSSALAVAAAATEADAGTEDPPAHDQRSSSAHQKYFSSQYPPGHDPDVSRNHDLNISKTWEHALAASRQTHAYEISKKFGFDHKEDVSKDYQYHERDVSKFSHDVTRSSTWPSNHFAEVSHDHPPGDTSHHAAESRIWPPNHTFARSSGWEYPLHTASVSRGFPPNHSVAMTRQGEVAHDWRLSVQYPQPHAADVSRSHSIAVSRSWPNFPTQHSVAASRTRPPNHFDAVSFTWPTTHVAVTSSNWPPNHFSEVSKTWDQNDPSPHTSWWSRVVPPGHTWFKSAQDTAETVKDIKEIVKTKKADAGTEKPEKQ